MGERIVIELHHSGKWHHAAELVVFAPEDGAESRTSLSYVDEYLEGIAEAFGVRDSRAVAESFPVGFGVWSRDSWPAFLFDIVPSGAARRWWMERLGSAVRTEKQLDWLLLRDHTVAPIGNLRIATEPAVGDAIGFARQDVIGRDVGFLEYAAEQGAAIGGATGAGGDAPKILLAEGADGEFFPDGILDDEDVVACWFVKWPRGRDSAADRLVLRTEHHYAHALANLGLDTCPGELHDDGESKPSLWLPRFDRNVDPDGIERLAVESLYSLANVTRPGATVSHQTFLTALRRALELRGQTEDLNGLVREYVRRDLLDVVVGNSDNHGRNRAIVRGERLSWAPIYDLAPMVLDPAGIIRSTRWDTHEVGGRIDWRGVLDELDATYPGVDLTHNLRDFAGQLLALPDLLRDRGVDDAIFEKPGIYLGRLPQTLQDWGLR